MGKAAYGSWDSMEFQGAHTLSRHEARELTDVQSRFSSRGFDIVLSRLRWPSGGDLRLVAPCCWLNIFLEAPDAQRSKPTYRGSAGLIRGLRVIAPPQAPIQVEWRDSEIDCITCWFDPSQFLLVRNLPWDWSSDTLSPASSALEESISSVTDLLVKEMLQPDLASDIKIESLMIYLSCQMHSWSSKASGAGRRDGLLDKRQLRLIRELTEDVAAPPTVALLASELRMSARLLCESFKASTGVTLRTFLAEQRVVRAKRLLLNPNLQIKKVAALAGFSTTSAFAAAFRKSVGINAREFRVSQHRSDNGA